MRHAGYLMRVFQSNSLTWILHQSWAWVFLLTGYFLLKPLKFCKFALLQEHYWCFTFHILTHNWYHIYILYIYIRGGILFWADTMGTNYVYSRPMTWCNLYGGFFKPCDYLAERAIRGLSLVRRNLLKNIIMCLQFWCMK